MSFVIARLLSWILNPIILIVFVPFFLIMKATGDSSVAVIWTGYTLLILGFFTLVLFIGKQKHLFTDLDVSHRTQRPLLFNISALFCLAYILGIFLFHGPFILLAVGLGIVFGIIVVSFVNTKIKASIHTATIAAIVFALVLVYGRMFAPLLLLIPLMSWARVKIKRHTISEAIVGAILGSLLSLSVYTLLRLFGHHA